MHPYIPPHDDESDNLHAEYGQGWGMPQAAYAHAGTDQPLVRLTGQTNLPTATARHYHQDGLGSVAAARGNKGVRETKGSGLVFCLLDPE